MLNIEKKIDNDKACFRLTGRLDTLTSPELESELTGIIDGLTDLVLDFEELEYVSSAGMRVLLAAQKKMNDLGTMTVKHVRQEIMDTFEMTGFDEILTIEN
ncbi:MAG: STAS domain-containing protein [Oscillospiraceae bacterium]|jgi:anti-sigma B factor antagonist|nr:STAS domain-containing protein [Oscillospiraceae bacterium]MBQ5341130.1 STAS domain-containing protein [Oscillospiraceae bacterium]MBR4827645.1 STAS domain-containing protein [Oscillospiraceae bacterium]MBR5064840.1 STAS domain-containing protein [Oscillospiraceae bacterium]